MALLQKALAAWPRRQAPLLEINCGNGAFLPLLWNLGFDVHGAEAEFGQRQTALRRPVPSLEVHAARDTDLPFDNDSFDWVILHLLDPENLETSAREAIRVARRGCMITFWNTSSLPSFFWQLTHKSRWAANGASWGAVIDMLRKQDMGRITMLSTLHTPVCLWKSNATHSPRLSALPLGSWCIGRLDIGANTPVTPLALRIGARLGVSPEPAMQYSQKRYSQKTQETTAQSQ